jgi:hypothetical protein
MQMPLVDATPQTNTKAIAAAHLLHIRVTPVTKTPGAPLA